MSVSSKFAMSGYRGSTWKAYVGKIHINMHQSLFLLVFNLMIY